MPSEVIRLICPNLKCRSILSVPASARGKQVRCRQCGTKIAVPAPPEIKEAPIEAQTADPQPDKSA